MGKNATTQVDTTAPENVLQPQQQQAETPPPNVNPQGAESTTESKTTGQRRARLDERLSGIDGRIGEIQEWMRELPSRLWKELQSQSLLETTQSNQDGRTDGVLPRHETPAGAADTTTNSQQVNQQQTTQTQTNGTNQASVKPRSVFRSRNG